MSVKLVNRNDSDMEFLKNARDIEVNLIKAMVNKPKRYRFFYQKIVELSIDVLNCLKKGNSIYVETREDELIRIREFKTALANVQAILSQMEIIHYLFKDEGMSINQIEIITNMLNTEIGLIKGLLKVERKNLDNIK